MNTAMHQLLHQLREERRNIPMDIEWDRCYQAIEMLIESTYLELEKEQVGQRSEQLIGFLKDYQKSCELMHVSKIDAKNFVDHWNPIN